MCDLIQYRAFAILLPLAYLLVHAHFNARLIDTEIADGLAKFFFVVTTVSLLVAAYFECFQADCGG